MIYVKQLKADGIKDLFHCSSFMILCLNIHILVVFSQSTIILKNTLQHRVLACVLVKTQNKMKEEPKVQLGIKSRTG